MKNFLLFLCLIPSIIFATIPDLPINSKIESATVFLSGAQVNRTAVVSLPSGESLIRIVGLTPNLDAKSIQVKGEGDFTILSVQHEANFEEKPNLGEDVSLLVEKIETMKNAIEDEEIILQALMSEEQFLNANNKIGGTQSGIPIDQLKAGANYIGQRMLQIKREHLKTRRKIGELKKELQVLNKERGLLTKSLGKYTMEILVKCNALQTTSGTFKFSYVVKSAGWFPNYDIRVKDVASDVNLDYRASVFQSSGEDWEKIKLTLSTGNPFESGVRPTLNPWKLAFYNRYSGGVSVIGNRNNAANYYIDGNRVTGVGGITQISGTVTDEYGEPLIGANVLIRGTTNGTTTDIHGNYTLALTPKASSVIVSYIGFDSAELPVNAGKMDVVLSEVMLLDEVVVSGFGSNRPTTASERVYQRHSKKKEKKKKATPSIPVKTSTVKKSTTVNFVIELPYSIPTSGKQTLVQIKDYDLPAEYEYFAIPKIDPNAFLTANVIGWEKYDLLSGEANLFFEGTFLGKSYLDVDAVEDTLALSLGRDKSIVIERNQKDEFSKKQFIGANKIERRAWDIEIRNKKNQAIHLVLEDQFPISTNDKIEVKKGNYDEAILEEKTGKLTWELDILENTKKQVVFDYEVKFPKKEHVVLE